MSLMCPYTSLSFYVALALSVCHLLCPFYTMAGRNQLTALIDHWTTVANDNSNRIRDLPLANEVAEGSLPIQLAWHIRLRSVMWPQLRSKRAIIQSLFLVVPSA